MAVLCDSFLIKYNDIYDEAFCVFDPPITFLQPCYLPKQRVQVRVFKFYLSVLLLIIKTNQSAREKLDSYCKNNLYK